MLCLIDCKNELRYYLRDTVSNETHVWDAQQIYDVIVGQGAKIYGILYENDIFYYECIRLRKTFSYNAFKTLCKDIRTERGVYNLEMYLLNLRKEESFKLVSTTIRKLNVDSWSVNDNIMVFESMFRHLIELLGILGY